MVEMRSGDVVRVEMRDEVRVVMSREIVWKVKMLMKGWRVQDLQCPAAWGLYHQKLVLVGKWEMVVVWDGNCGEGREGGGEG